MKLSPPSKEDLSIIFNAFLCHVWISTFILGESYIFVMFNRASEQGAKALIFISQILFAGMLSFLAYWILKNIKRKIKSTSINSKKFLSSLLIILLVIPSLYIIPLILDSLTLKIFGETIYVGKPLIIFTAIAIYVQGIFLILQIWINSNLAYYRDMFLGFITVIFSFILLAFNFRMEIATQLLIILLCSVILFSVFDTMRLRKND